MEKRDKKIPYEVVIQERKRVDLYGNVVYYIYWFDKYGNDITNEWKFWSKGPKKKYDRVNRYLTGTQGFYRCNDAGTLPGECADFIFHKCND